MFSVIIFTTLTISSSGLLSGYITNSSVLQFVCRKCVIAYRFPNAKDLLSELYNYGLLSPAALGRAIVIIFV
jgi:hypothetical protein